MGVESINSRVIKTINFELLKAKLFYFFYLTAIMTLMPYLYLYYKHVLFLSPEQVTILLAIRPVCLIFAAPILGTLADRTNKFKTVMLICLGGSIITYGLISIMEPVEDFNCKDAIAAGATLTDNTTLLSNKSTLSKFLKATEDREYFFLGRLMEDSLYSWPFNIFAYKETSKVTRKLFFTILGITIAGEMISSPAYTFADVYTMQALGDETYRYGHQILPGVVGTGIVSAILILFTNFKFMSMTSICDKSLLLAERPFFIEFLIFMVLSFGTAVFFNFHLNTPSNDKKRDSFLVVICCSGCKVLESIRLIFKNPSFACFMILVLLSGIGDGAKTSFTYTFLADRGKVKDYNSFLPIITATHFISHVVFLSLSGKILLRFGHVRIIAAGILVYALSFFVYGLINDPVLIFIVEPFDGIPRQLLKVAVFTYVGSPAGMGASLQGITHAIYLGMGTSIGSFICGFLVQKVGYVVVFISLGIVCFIGFMFCLAVDHYLPSDQTIAETFMTYQALRRSASESEFSFLLEEVTDIQKMQQLTNDDNQNNKAE